MSSTRHTGHYNLSQFDDTDKPTWRGDYNGDMGKIDDQMFANAQAAQAAQTAATSATGAAQAASQAAQTSTNILHNMGLDEPTQGTTYTQRIATVEQTANNNSSYFAAMGITNTSQAQQLVATVNGKADTSSVTNLQSQINGKANLNEVYTQSQSDARYTQAGGYSGTTQSLVSSINGNTQDIATLQSQAASFTAIANGLTGATKWKGAHINRTIGAFNVNIWVYYNEPSGLFCVFGEMFAASVTAGTAFKAGFTQSTDTDALFPESWRPSKDVEIPMYAMTTSGSTVSAASLMIKPSGTLEASVLAGAVPGSGAVSIDVRFWGQICSIGLVKTLEN